jgi:hypothetical protein
MPKSFRQRQGGAPPRVARSWDRDGDAASNLIHFPLKIEGYDCARRILWVPIEMVELERSACGPILN